MTNPETTTSTQTSVWEDFVDIFTNPSAVFARRENGNFWLPMLVVTLVIGGLFFATKGVKELKIGAQLDYLLVTTAQQPNWHRYFPIMAPGSTIFPLTISNGDLTMPYLPIITSELKIQGSVVASREVHRKMLEFAARHGVKPIIERFSMSVRGVEESMEKLRKGKMRYRGVLVAEEKLDGRMA